jgi:hypothetical protein
MQLNQTCHVSDEWQPYCERFSGTPEYYFSVESGLQYPHDSDHAAQQIQKLKAEIESIDIQIQERDCEVRGALALERQELETEFHAWKARALRAQRMRLSQIHILQAWMVDNVPTLEERVSALERDVRQLKSQA